MKKYKHLFFDLDRTLWDWDANSHATLLTLFEKYNLAEYAIDFDLFEKCYMRNNDTMWILFREGKISKEVLRYHRFYLTLLNFKIDSITLASSISEDYVTESPRGTLVVPDTFETLDYLSSHYQIHILSNGFKNIQDIKLTGSGLKHYFNHIVTSESCGYLKPDKRIFHYALSSINARKNESLMIGDDLEADIVGAQKYGIDQVFCNYSNQEHQLKPTFEIHQLKQLVDIL